MNILVTGTSGFIAKKLAAKLKKARHTVYCLDKTSSGLENEIVLHTWWIIFKFLEENVMKDFITNYGLHLEFDAISQFQRDKIILQSTNDKVAML